MEEIWICQFSNKIVGIIAVRTLTENNNQKEIGFLAVDKKFRRKKIGTTLLLKVINHYKPQTLIKISTPVINLGARQFYENNGFKVSGSFNYGCCRGIIYNYNH